MDVQTHHRALRGFGIVAVVQTLIRLRTLLLIPVLVKGLGQDGFGVWTIVVVSVAVASLAVPLGMPQVVERFLPARTEARDLREDFYSCLLVVLAASLASLGVVLAGAEGLSRRLAGDAGLAPLIRLSAWILAATSLNQVAVKFFRARREMGWASFFDFVGGYGEVALAAAFVQQGRGVLGALEGLGLARAGATAAALLLVLWRIGFAFPRFLRLGEFLRFGIPTILLGLTWWVVESVDRYFIGWLTGDLGQVGIYSTAYFVGSIMVLFRVPFMFVLPNFVFRFWDQGETGAVRDYLAYSLKYFTIAAVPAGVALTLLAGPVLRVLANPACAAGGARVVPFVALAMFCWGLSGITGLVLWFRNQTRELSLLWGAAALVNTALNWLLIPRMGLLGAAAATLAAYALPAVVCGAVYVRQFGTGRVVPFLVRVAVSTAVMGIVVRALNPQDVQGLVATAAAGGAVYAAMILLTRTVRRDEMGFLRRSLRIG